VILGRPVEYIEVANANKFLENSHHDLIVDKESDLQQIDEKLRRIIVSDPYRHRRTAYLLKGRQLQDNSRLKLFSRAFSVNSGIGQSR
jgi:hypothetical protein